MTNQRVVLKVCRKLTMEDIDTKYDPNLMERVRKRITELKNGRHEECERVLKNIMGKFYKPLPW